jgi:hypothetical protein
LYAALLVLFTIPSILILMKKDGVPASALDGDIKFGLICLPCAALAFVIFCFLCACAAQDKTMEIPFNITTVLFASLTFVLAGCNALDDSRPYSIAFWTPALSVLIILAAVKSPFPTTPKQMAVQHVFCSECAVESVVGTGLAMVLPSSFTSSLPVSSLLPSGWILPPSTLGNLTLDLQTDYRITSISLRNTATTGTSDFKVQISSDGEAFTTVLGGPLSVYENMPAADATPNSSAYYSYIKTGGRPPLIDFPTGDGENLVTARYIRFVAAGIANCADATHAYSACKAGLTEIQVLRSYCSVDNTACARETAKESRQLSVLEGAVRHVLGWKTFEKQG